MKLLGEGCRKSRSTSRGIELSAFRRGDQNEFLNASNLQAEIRGRKEKNVILFCAYISERKGRRRERVTILLFLLQS